MEQGGGGRQRGRKCRAEDFPEDSELRFNINGSLLGSVGERLLQTEGAESPKLRV